MSPITFIANIGGMLGLCMGFSFVSLVEIFFFASQILVGQIKKKWKVLSKFVLKGHKDPNVANIGCKFGRCYKSCFVILLVETHSRPDVRKCFTCNFSRKPWPVIILLNYNHVISLASILLITSHYAWERYWPVVAGLLYLRPSGAISSYYYLNLDNHRAPRLQLRDIIIGADCWR